MQRFSVFVPSAFSGVLSGCLLAYDSSALLYYRHVASCPRYDSQEACAAIGPHTGCGWLVSGARNFTGASGCRLLANGVDPYAEVPVGVYCFALGFCIAAAPVPWLARRVGIRQLIVVGFAVAALATLLQAAAWSMGHVAWVILSRCLAGACSAVLCVAWPMYSADYWLASGSAENHGLVFRAAFSSGVALDYIVCLSASQTTFNEHYPWLHFQGVNVLTLIVALAGAVAHWRLPALLPPLVIADDSLELTATAHLAHTFGEDPLDFTIPHHRRMETWTTSITHHDHGKTTLGSVVLLGVILACCMTVSGQFAIRFLDLPGAEGLLSEDLPPFAHTAIVAAVAVAGNLVASVPISKIGSAKCFLASLVLSSVACGVSGAFAYPGALQPGLQQSLAFCAKCIQVFLFEVGVGPGFYVLALLFLESDRRELTCSLANGLEGLGRAVVAFTYPIAKSAVDGATEPGMGSAVLLVVFCALGIAFTILTLKLFRILTII
jgi:hypothetical protein